MNGSWTYIDGKGWFTRDEAGELTPIEENKVPGFIRSLQKASGGEIANMSVEEMDMNLSGLAGGPDLDEVFASLFKASKECTCPDCTARRQQENEQNVLRSIHGTKMEYVWSEILKCHMPIGEKL